MEVKTFCVFQFESDDIRAVVSSITGTLKCGPEEIKAEVEQHLLSVFQGSFDPIPPDREESRSDHLYHGTGGDGSGGHGDQQQDDHSYASSQSPTLPQSDGSGTLQTDPQGWMDRSFSFTEVKKASSLLQNCKALIVYQTSLLRMQVTSF